MTDGRSIAVACSLAGWLAGCDRVFGIGDPYEDAAAMPPSSDAMHDAAADTTIVPGDGTGVPTPTLLERFPFDGDLSNSTNTASATPTGNITVSATGGRFGGHASLDGTGCLVFTFTQQPSQFSIVLWLEEPTANAMFVPLFVRPHVAASTVQDWAFYGTDSSIRFSMAGGAETYMAAPGLSTSWHQYAVTFDGAFVHQFFDGSDQGGISGTAPVYGTGTDIYLGCDGAGGNGKFAGGFDELEIYDGALTATQVMALTMAPPS